MPTEGSAPRASRASRTEALDVQSLSIQASGHEDTLSESKCDGEKSLTGRSKTLFKKLDTKEHENYEEIFAADDPLQKALPRFWGVVEVGLESGNGNEEAAPQSFLILEHLLADFTVPFVMDTKLGIRSYEESECKSKKLRPDLYQRLQKIGPEYLSEEDHKNGSITKHFWMSTRDSMSSLKSLGFRVDGVVGPGNLKIHADYFANIVDREKVLAELKRFLDNLPPNGDSEDGAAQLALALRNYEEFHKLPKRSATEDQVRNSSAGIEGWASSDRQATHGDGLREAILVRRELAAMVAEKVWEVRDNCIASPFFARHEFIGASLLISVEAAPPRIKPRVKAAVIDLAKTSLLPDDCTVDHRRCWAPGNHEDGVLLGLEFFFACWSQVEAQYCEEFRQFGGALPSRAEALAQIYGESSDVQFYSPDGNKSGKTCMSTIDPSCFVATPDEAVFSTTNADTRLCDDLITQVSCGFCSCGPPPLQLRSTSRT